MSADEWRACPLCYQKLKDILETHKDNPDTPLNFEEIKHLDMFTEEMETGYSRNLGKTDVEKGKLVSIEDKLRESNEFENQSLLPSSGNLQPVEIRYEYGIDEDSAWFSLMAECRNCSHKFEVEQR